MHQFISDLFDLEALQGEIDGGFIQQRHHPHLPLTIYTYTRACQYEQHWNHITTRCRGLVVENTTGRIVAHCLPKFFNYSEHQAGKPYAPPLPEHEPFDLTGKLDGSLAIVFHYPDHTYGGGPWRVASKGSFVSEQARWAAERIQRMDTSGLRTDLTYLAEAIYPENRIVVNYDGRKDLALLAVIRSDGVELPAHRFEKAWGPIGSPAPRWDACAFTASDIAKLAADNTRHTGGQASGTDAEGYVIRFASGTRVKIKFNEYIRLHKLLTGITERDVWRAAGVELLADQPVKDLARTLCCSTDEITAMLKHEQGPLAALVENVPDEFDTWVRSTADRLIERADILRNYWMLLCAPLMTAATTRAEFARRVTAQIADGPTRAAMFLLYDRRSVRLHAWRLIKPERVVPFATDDEEN